MLLKHGHFVLVSICWVCHHIIKAFFRVACSSGGHGVSAVGAVQEDDPGFFDRLPDEVRMSVWVAADLTSWCDIHTVT
jgi:hypothetical protein